MALSKEGRALALAAAELLEKEGWIQGDFYTAQGHCAVGALREARDRGGVDDNVRSEVYQALKALGAVIDYSVSVWNDRPERTADEVINMFRTLATEGVEIDAKDLKIDAYRADGQIVNENYRAVRLTHIPTGIVAYCDTERTQLQNKAKALQELRIKLAEEGDE